MQYILVTRDSGYGKNYECLVIGELTNLILVIGELRRYIPPNIYSSYHHLQILSGKLWKIFMQVNYVYT